MTIEQMLLSKLAPHTKRIKDGEGNDFDYLPAVLLQLMEEEKRQSQQLDSIKSTVVSNAAASATQIAAFENSAQRKLEQLEATIKDIQTQIQNSQSLLSEQMVGIASAHAGYATKINEGLSAIGLQIESLGASNQRSQVKFTRILIAGLVASTVMIGLAIAILQRH